MSDENLMDLVTKGDVPCMSVAEMKKTQTNQHGQVKQFKKSTKKSNAKKK